MYSFAAKFVYFALHGFNFTAMQRQAAYAKWLKAGDANRKGISQWLK